MRITLVSGTLATKDDIPYKGNITFNLPMVDIKADKELYKIVELIERTTGLFVADIYFHTIEDD